MAQLKISDLSVGDWVLNRQGVPTKVQVIVSEGNMRCGEDAKPEHSVHIWVSDVEPIPLTPEILEKNGLCVVEEDADFSEYELFGSENFSIFHLKGTLHYRLETPQASLVCWNVHQLQHALRLAGVEKEIEL